MFNPVPESSATPGIPAGLQAQLEALMDGTKLMVETATGYRNQLIAADWPQEMAVQVAGHFLIQLQTRMFAGQPQVPADPPKGKKR